MSRYLGPRGRILKRLGPFSIPGFGFKLNKKLEKKAKAAYEEICKKRGQKKGKKKGKKGKSAEAYILRLQEKQKLRYHYGLTEKYLMNSVEKARRQNGPTGQILLNGLEMRLDNIVYRCGYAPTLPAARQLVTHGHILLNGKKVDRPGSQCQVKDSISLKKECSYKRFRRTRPDFINFIKTPKGPQRLKPISQIQKKPTTRGLKINELLVIEYYSRS